MIAGDCRENGASVPLHLLGAASSKHAIWGDRDWWAHIIYPCFNSDCGGGGGTGHSGTMFSYLPASASHRNRRTEGKRQWITLTCLCRGRTQWHDYNGRYSMPNRKHLWSFNDIQIQNIEYSIHFHTKLHINWSGVPWAAFRASDRIHVWLKLKWETREKLGFIS